MESSAWAQAISGPFDAVEALGEGRRGVSTRVLRRRGLPVAVLKEHASPRKFAQELHAYGRWARALPATAQLIAARTEAPYALLLTYVDGAPTRAHDPDVHRRAGAWLRRLHDLPHDDADPVPLGRALAERFERWGRRVEGLVSSRVSAALGRHAATLAQLDLARVPCHRDYAPHNWLVDGDELKVIDFEHARADLWLVDVAKLVDESWAIAPECAEAFWDGYGRGPGADEQIALDACRALHAVATFAWGRDHGDPEFVALGERLIARLEARG